MHKLAIAVRICAVAERKDMTFENRLHQRLSPVEWCEEVVERVLLNYAPQWPREDGQINQNSEDQILPEAA